MSARRASRVLAALAAAGALVVPLAGPAAATVTPPACATTPVHADWTTHYADGRYELATVTLDGLGACAGAEVIVGIASGTGIPEELETTVPTGTLVLDVADLQLAAARVDQLALTLTAEVEPATDPGEESSTDGATPDSDTPAVPDAAAGGSLPGTGVDAIWFAGLAAALTILGVALRRRARREENADA